MRLSSSVLSGLAGFALVLNATTAMAQLQLTPAPSGPQQQPAAPRPPQPQKPPVKPAEPPPPAAETLQNGEKPKAGDLVAPGAPDETVIAPPKQKIANATAVFSGLDKITGRIIVFEVAIDETVQFGALQVTPRVCYTRPPTETPQTTAFAEVNEVTLSGELRKQFKGWMFAASPGLSGVEHPVYDIWLADCKAGKPNVAPAKPKS